MDEFGDRIIGCKHMLPLRTTDLTRSTLTPLHPAALASVPYGIVLVRVRVRLARHLRKLMQYLHKWIVPELGAEGQHVCLQPMIWSPNSSTERPGSSAL